MSQHVAPGRKYDAVVDTTPSDAIRHRLLMGLIERIARADRGFVLRGGMLTRMWVAPAPRVTRDLDYVACFDFDRDATAARIARALAVAVDDDVAIDASSLTAHGMWTDTAFPGVRLTCALGLGRAGQRQRISIDVGFHDPLVPAATTIELPSGARAAACRPETQLAWKLHALAEMEHGWRPKDVADLWLITRHAPWTTRDLTPAIEAAFASRGFALARAASTLAAAHWTTKTARVRWDAYRARLGELPPILDAIRARIAPALDALAHHPT